MSIAATINDHIKQAMLAKDKDRLAALRDVKSKILLEATSGSGSEVSDEVAMKICLKLYKQRMETYELYMAQGREDLATDEMIQAKVIEEFLPKQLSEEEIKAEIELRDQTIEVLAEKELVDEQYMNNQEEIAILLGKTTKLIGRV